MSEEASRAFLSVTAQVSATFVGFALLTPLFRFLGSEVFRKGAQAIRRRPLFLRCLGVALTPVIILLLPLLKSLLLLSNNLQLPDTCHLGTFAVAAIAALVWLVKMPKMDVEWKWLPKILLERLPMVITFGYLLGTVISLLGRWNLSAHCFYLMMISLIIAGLLLLGRTFVFRPEVLPFRPQDLQKEFKCGIELLKKAVKEALDRRDKKLRWLQQQQYSKRKTYRRESYQQESDIARQEAEIRRWREILRKITKRESEFSEGEIYLPDCIDWLSWKDKWESNLEEFEVGTIALEELMRQIGGER